MEQENAGKITIRVLEHFTTTGKFTDYITTRLKLETTVNTIIDRIVADLNDKVKRPNINWDNKIEFDGINKNKTWTIEFESQHKYAIASIVVKNTIKRNPPIESPSCAIAYSEDYLTMYIITDELKNNRRYNVLTDGIIFFLQNNYPEFSQISEIPKNAACKIKNLTKIMKIEFPCFFRTSDIRYNRTTIDDKFDLITVNLI
jgi:hypothetical protein